jgi:hypothetical protein
MGFGRVTQRVNSNCLGIYGHTATSEYAEPIITSFLPCEPCFPSYGIGLIPGTAFT